MPRIDLTDLTDPQYAGFLRDYTSLRDVQLRTRREPAEGLFLAESVEVIRRALEAGYVPRSFLVSPHRYAELADDLPTDAPAFVAPAAVVEELTGVDLHRGALGSFVRPVPRTVSEVLAALPPGPARLVVLEDVADATNVGAIIRSVAAFGVDGVIVSPRCADPLYRRSVRVSMGTVLHLPWARATSWPGDLDLLRSSGFTVAALALSDDSVALGSFEAPQRLAFLLGTEGDGLSRRALAASDLVVRIPMDARVDSLNVAAASAVALWETRVLS
ncbi:TrmH family RNA methyltransferase [Kineococcus sp. SYSU DK003]|uniref:TrmH family RNA methyltransferase n=1 Tax=Kineococcus sp. SYSU DK003 TaxID=3383124 RepID=UPI003D7E2244